MLIGEYWITETGDTIECDGDRDINARNHLAVVAQQAWKRIADGVQNTGNPVAKFFVKEVQRTFLPNEPPDLPYIRQTVNAWADTLYKENILSEDAADDIYGWLALQADVSEDIVSLAFNVYDFRTDAYRDGREYAMVVLDWVRVQDHHLQLGRISQPLCERLYSALQKLYCTNGLTMADFAKTQWEVETTKPNRIGYTVPCHVLGDANLLLEQLLSTNLV